ncbi:MAG: ABC transporter permease [Bacteroidales bacterium]|nr:ABC transporter permease [Clostridium sp.]MCM1202935.1 ABC transporter permease [Bacteroidales bacterium]
MNIWKVRFETFFHYTDLIKELVKKDLKLKYRRSFLGYLWSILNPLMIMIIMTIVFSTMFSRSIDNFAVYLISGRTIFEFVTHSTTQAMMSIRGNAALIKKVYIPKYVFPLAKITSSIVDCVFSMGALIIVMVFTRAPFTPYFFMIPFVIVQVYIFACGLGFFLAQAVVFFRDIQYIYSAVTTAWMYLTPLFYPLDRLPETVAWLVVHFNPCYSYVTQFRDCVYNAAFSEPWLVAAGWAWAILVFLFGLFTFKRSQDKFILYI